jgi:predicted 3-demethylubiquinone-9 3-methyltransferase (glyoxalase superfamily)
VKDRWGFSWQIVPRKMMQWLTGSDDIAKARAFGAMLQMTKMDIAALEIAVAGQSN